MANASVDVLVFAIVLALGCAIPDAAHASALWCVAGSSGQGLHHQNDDCCIWVHSADNQMQEWITEMRIQSTQRAGRREVVCTSLKHESEA
jgi:hypothetical protein